MNPLSNENTPQRAPRTPLGSLVQFLSRLLGASRCPACGRALAPGQSLCPDCARTMAPRGGGFCPGCGARFGLESYEPSLCGDCRESPRPWRRFVFHSTYEEPLRSLILSFKFSQGLGRTELLRRTALQALDGWLANEDRPHPDLVVPVPLHPKRLRWRGYNQAAELARPLANRLGTDLAHTALVRTRNTVPQSTLSGPDRLTNLKGAFRADHAQVNGKHALLVDDVMTTGSTLEECARALAESGAASVDVLVLARA